jgi:hypothetical protein
MSVVADHFLRRIRAKFADVELYREQMHGYQNTGLKFLKENPFSGLFIDMGLGKTVTTATLIADLAAEFVDDNPVLVIGPLRVATQTWPDEFRKWNHLAHLNLSIIHVDDDDPRVKAASLAAIRAKRAECAALRMFKSEIEKEAQAAGTRAAAQMREDLREAATLSKASVHLISRDWVEWLVAYYRVRKLKWPYRTVIIDESSGFKDHNAARFKALQAVRDQPGFITRMHILTATPAAESYLHLFAQIYLIDGGKRFGKEITRFREEFFTENRYTRKWKLRPGAEPAILAKISDICLVMKEEDYLPRTPPLFVTRHVTMSPEQMALYRKMEADMVVTLDDGSEIEAETAAALSAKLLQMASGVLYETKLEPGETDEDDHVKIQKIHQIHTHKLEELKQIIEESQGRNILVGYHHRASKDRLKKAFGTKITFMDADGKCVKPWNAGKIPILAMHPASGGHGLNLQKGGHIIVFYDIPWSLELYLQFIGRLARQGQKHRVLVYLLVCRETLDEAVVQALTAKEDAQDMLFRLMKRMRTKLRKLLKGRKKVQPEDADWDQVVEILADTKMSDEVKLEDEIVDDVKRWYYHPESDSYAQMTLGEWATCSEAGNLVEVDELDVPDEFLLPHECCPRCGDAGGPCGPGSDCYEDDEL